MTKVTELKTLPDVKRYWQDCLTLRTNSNDLEIAGYITGVVSSDNFHAWYQEGSGEKWFVDVFELASQLEIPDGDPAARQKLWQELILQISE